MTTYNCPHCGGEISPASLMGQMTSDKKKAAAIANGKKGGRPKKDATMKKLSKSEINTILRSNFGWGDTKRKLCEALGVPYDWHYELPQYILDHIALKTHGKTTVVKW